MKTNYPNLSILLVLIIFFLLFYRRYLIKNKENYFTISDDKINDENCKKWFNNRDIIPIRNPLTNKKINKNGDLYKELNKKCRKYEKINKRNYRLIDTVPSYLKVLYKMLYNGYVKINTDKPDENYDRKKLFGDGWKKVENSECDIRSVLLNKENKGNLVFSPSKCNLTNDCEIKDLKCTIFSGIWQPTTGNYFTNNLNPIYEYATLVDIDHTVPLKHVYNSGAFKWPKWLKEKYANDLTPGHLFTMVYYLNTEKGEKDPSEWIPPEDELRYVSNWLAVKYRYGLIIEPVEFNAIQIILDKYQDFTPDKEIDLSLDIGYETKTNFVNLLDPIYKENRETIINNFNKNINKDIKILCNNNKTITNKELNLFKEELLKNKNHVYFGLLRPEYVNLIKKPDDICNYI